MATIEFLCLTMAVNKKAKEKDVIDIFKKGIYIREEVFEVFEVIFPQKSILVGVNPDEPLKL